MVGKSRSPYDLVALTVLALLTQKPCHPYEIQRLIRDTHKDFAVTTTRSLYHAVEKLTKDGLIEPVETTREGKRPERTVYQITPNGREEFEIWLREMLAKPVTETPVFMAAISFIGGLSMSEALRSLQMRTVTLEGQIADLDTRLRALNAYLPRLFLLEVEYTRAQWHSELNWVRTIIEDIQSGALKWDAEVLGWKDPHAPPDDPND